MADLPDGPAMRAYKLRAPIMLTSAGKKLADAAIAERTQEYIDAIWNNEKLREGIEYFSERLMQAEATVKEQHRQLLRKDTGGWFYDYDRERSQRIKLEQKYDGLMRALQQCEGTAEFEVFTAPDGETGIRYKNWKEALQQAEADS